MRHTSRRVDVSSCVLEQKFLMQAELHVPAHLFLSEPQEATPNAAASASQEHHE